MNHAEPSLEIRHADATAPFEFVIAPPSGIVSINWGELWRYRELFTVMAWRDISVRYKQTILGILWAVLQPLINTMLFTVIFNRVAHIPSGSANVPYSIYVYLGLLFWQFYSNTLTGASNSMVSNAAIIQKVYFPRLIVPATAATTALVDAAIAAVFYIGMAFYFHIYPGVLGLLLLPVLVVVAVLSAMGVGLFLASLNIKYRDVRIALPFFVQLLMYITPVVYPAKMLAKYQLLKVFILWLNPISGVIDTARATFLHSEPFNPEMLGVSALMSVVFFFAGLYYFRSTERYFADIA